MEIREEPKTKTETKSGYAASPCRGHSQVGWQSSATKDHEETKLQEREDLEAGTRLVLPSDEAEQWAYVETVLKGPIEKLADLDTILTKFAEFDDFPRVCTFFQSIPGSEEAGKFDFESFFLKGVPLLIDIALEMPQLFAGMEVPIFKTYSSWTGTKTLTLTRRQCACLLSHSFFGSLKRPKGVERNNFRFTVVDLFMGTAVSPNSATTFLNYFTMLGKHGIPDGSVTFERRGYHKGPSPWNWEHNKLPLCHVEMVNGSIEDSMADVHAEFANAFIGGGVMTGDFAMEEILFLVKPELMVAMAVQNRMADTEAICVSGALQYSLITGYGSSFEFAGDYDNRRAAPPPTVCAIDAIRGGGPAMTEVALLRDLNKARIAFEGARQVATGHWGCGAFGNNHDLMFLKQWMAASGSGAEKMYYYEFDKKQSHSIVPLVRKMQHMTVGQLWDFLREVSQDLQPRNLAVFSTRMADIAVGRLKVEGCASHVKERKSTLGVEISSASVSSQPQVTVATPSDGNQPSSSDPQEKLMDTFEGKVVIYQGEEMICIKQTTGAQLRLQKTDGRTTWASKKEVTLKQ